MDAPRKFWLLLIASLCAAACVPAEGGFAAGKSGKLTAPEVAQIIQTLDELPPPTNIQANDVKERQRTVETLQALGRYGNSQLRAAVKQFWLKYPNDLDQQSKIFLLNRCIFAVPEKAPKDAEYFDSWGFQTADPSNYMRPLSLSREGRIGFVGSFSFYIGPPYLALNEFDYFAKRFGRRS